MKRFGFDGKLLLFAVLAISLAASAPVLAADTLDGALSVVKDAAGKVTGATLAAVQGNQPVALSITFDDKGKALAADLDGLQAEVTGDVAAKDGAKWLTVQSYRLIAIGALAVTKDDAGKPKSVKLAAERAGAGYAIVLDAIGQKLAAEKAKLPLEVRGALSTKDGVKWITVQAYCAMAKMKGLVDVKKSDKGVVVSISLTVKPKGGSAVTYNVLLDAAGSKMASAKAGVKLDLIGVVTDKGGAKWVKVYGFEQEEEEEEGEEGGEGEEDGD